MPNETPDGSVAPSQLNQLRVPLEDAADAFAGPNPPMVLVPRYALRIRNDFLAAAGIAIVAGIAAGLALGSGLLFLAGIVLGVLLLALAAIRALLVQVPEGTVALLNRGGRYAGELPAGAHVLPPWFQVTYLVSTREIPYDAPVLEAVTQDNVRASVDTLLTFAVLEAHRFVYSISAADFDRVLAAATQDTVRLVVRQADAEHVSDLAHGESETLRAQLSEVVKPYGVEIRRVVITQARPPEDFVRSLEARQLASVYQAEEVEQHALALERQADQEVLARNELLARLERERQELEQQVDQAEMRRRVVEADVETQAQRLARLDEALRAYPLAAEWETQGARLDVVRALADNPRAIVQMGEMDEITRAVVNRDLYQQSTRRDAEPNGRPAQ